jgi:hypothetical protein
MTGNFFSKWGLVLILTGFATLILAVTVGVILSEPTSVAERVHTECLDGFEYYTRSFNTHHGMGVAMAPKWDKDGKPKRCSTEKETP